MNVLDFLKKQFRPIKGVTIPAAQVPPLIKSDASADFVNKFGVVTSDLRQILQDQSLVLYERSQIYQSIDRSLVHPLMSAACSIYADTATVRSPLHESTVWVTSKSKEYTYHIEKMFDIINMEEVIYDWAWSIATFGDQFVQLYGEPGVGLVSVNDDNHPINISRVDYNGRLIGFYETPLGYSVADERKLMTPWDYCHLRLLGAKRRRPIYADPQYSEFRCLTGNTEIMLLNNKSVRMTEMEQRKENYLGKYVWSINPITLELEPDRIVDVRKTKLNAELVRVHLDNDEFIDCTPDHKFMLRDGSFVEAQNLQSNVSLMPYYPKPVSFGKYNYVYNPGIRKYVNEHVLVAEFVGGRKVKSDEVVHHRDFNGMNNDPSNLVILDRKVHSDFHIKINKRRWVDEKYRAKVIPKLSKASNRMWADEKYRQNQLSGCKQAWENNDERRDKLSKSALDLWKNDEYRNKIIDKSKINGNKSEIKTKLSISSNRNWSNSAYREKMRLRDENERIKAQEKRLELFNKIEEFVVNNIDRLNSVDCLNVEVYKLFGTSSHQVWKVIKQFTNLTVGQYLELNKKRQLIHNHKVVRVERLTNREDTYDIQTERNHNFPLKQGVFVHNSISIMTPDIRRLTSKYGQSVLADALPIYKRLRLAEDSILMARISRGILRYIYKVAVEGNNNEAVAKIIDNYVDELKRARALNVDPNNPNYVDRYQALAGIEDIIMPVWKDVNSVAVEKIGGEVDIRWIVDVTELIKQLSTALKVPLPLLAGYAEQAPPSLGNGSIERLDIPFARQSRRIQRAIINGLTRMAQIHLAYQGMDPDLNLFQIQMAETSSAEEEELKNALDTGVDVATKLAELWEKMIGPDADKMEILDYLNKKLLKLNDADLQKFIKKVNPNAFTEPRTEELVPGVETPEKKEEPAANPFRESVSVSDLKSALPRTVKEVKINETTTIRTGCNEDWETNWGNKIVKITPCEDKENVK